MFIDIFMYNHLVIFENTKVRLCLMSLECQGAMLCFRVFSFHLNANQ